MIIANCAVYAMHHDNHNRQNEPSNYSHSHFGYYIIRLWYYYYFCFFFSIIFIHKTIFTLFFFNITYLIWLNELDLGSIFINVYHWNDIFVIIIFVSHCFALALILVFWTLVFFSFNRFFQWFKDFHFHFCGIWFLYFNQKTVYQTANPSTFNEFRWHDNTND